MEHEMMTALAIGGPRYGEWITAPAGRSVMVAERGLLDTPHIYNPHRWAGNNWKIAIPFWVWDGYPLLADGTPEVPSSDMPAHARSGVWPEVCILCEICKGRALNAARAAGIFRCDEHWPEVYA